MTKSDQEIFELLRQERNERARELGIKPFMIFHNKTLQEASRVRPPTIEKLLEIKGISQKKAEKYGQIILEVVNRSIIKAEISPNIEKKSPEKVFSVSEFIRDLNSILIHKRAAILGEVGQVSPRNGYLFFKLKDKKEEATLNCFVRRYQLENFGIDLKDGLEIKVSGFPRIYEPTGSMTFEVEHIGLVGEGALKIAFEKLKEGLEKQGYFAPERKRPIPKFADSIGLITSQFADAKTDFLEHLGNFGFKIYFQDVRVEGFYATDEIVSAIKWFNENLPEVGVLVLTRGGGSLESLQTFNSEAVAKAIFGSKIPIITGIGHEVDSTIADLVADRRASTPTHAARILSDPWRQAAGEIAIMQKGMTGSFNRVFKMYQIDLGDIKAGVRESFERVMSTKRWEVASLTQSLQFALSKFLERYKIVEAVFLQNVKKFRRELVSRQGCVEVLEQDITGAFAARLKLIKSLLAGQKEKLELSSPLKRLKQGYSIVMLGNTIIRSVNQLKIDDIINTRFFRGEVLSQIKEVRGGKQE